MYPQVMASWHAPGMAPSGAQSSGLLERSEEMGLVGELLAQAAKGSGASLVVEGPAGIGKTSVLAAARALALDAGFRVLGARPGYLEHDLGWSVARDLLARAVAGLGEGERPEVLSGAAQLACAPLGIPCAPGPEAGSAYAGDVAPALYGMYWLCSNLAQMAPLLMVVDDAHWSDPPSARLLSYLSQRISDLPVLMVLGVRSGEELGDEISALRSRSHATRLAPLSAGAAALLVRAATAGWAGEDLCLACHNATGGNPFLLHELAGELARRGPSVLPGQVARLKPATVTRTVLLRLARLPVQARSLAITAAVLGHGGTLADAAALNGLSREQAAQMHDLLVSTDILRPGDRLELAHPLVADVIYAESPAAQRSELHHAAARRAYDLGRPVEDIAAQLLSTVPGGEPWVVEQLEAAAQVALGRAAPQLAASYLRRALAEGAAPADVGLLCQIGVAEAAAHLPGAVEHLLDAHAHATDPAQRADVVLQAAPLLVLEGRLAEAAELCEQALEEVRGDRERELRLIANILSGSLLDRDLHPYLVRALASMGPPPEGLTPGERVALAVAARVDLQGGVARPPAGQGPAGQEPVRRAGALPAAVMSRRALAGGLLLAEVGPEDPLYWYPTTSLLFAGWHDECRQAVEAGLADARRRGSVLGFAMASCFRSALNYRVGRLGEAVADARQSLESGALDLSTVLRAYATSFLVDYLVEVEAREDARRALAAVRLPEGAREVYAYAMVRASAARLDIAEGALEKGAVALMAAGPVLDDHGSPAMVPWRAPAAMALAGCGRAEEGRRLAEEDLELARASGSGWALSISLRASGMVREEPELLEEAVSVAQLWGAPLEAARAMCDLGAMLRRAGARRSARQLLETAAEAAEACQASSLARRAGEELAICGGNRPLSRRSPLGLTPSERRVAEMTASGLSNPEIAQALFVSLRTVETHLTHVYRKLGIEGRRKLASALERVGTGPPSAGARP